MRCTEEMKLWLFDLAHGNLNDRQILNGFIKHYVLHDCGIRDIQRDIAFHTSYSQEQTQYAVFAVKRVLENMAEAGEE